MRKIIALTLTCLMLLASVPAAHADSAPMTAFKQFLRYVADNNDVGAWRMFTANSKKLIIHISYEGAKGQGGDVTEEQIAQLFDSENPKVLKGFFDGMRQKVDFADAVNGGTFSEKQLDAGLVCLVVSPKVKWASVMAEDDGAWKLDLEATMKLAK